MPSKLEITLADNVRESVNFDSILKKGNKIQALSAKYASAIMFTPDASIRANAVQALQTEIVTYFDKQVIPAAVQTGREQAKRVVRQIGGGIAPADINDETLRRRILFEGDAKAADRLRIVQRLVNDQGNTLENRLGVYWLEPGRDAKAKLDTLRRLHEENEARRIDYEKRLVEFEARGGEGRRPAAPRLDFLSRFTKEATQSVREQGRRVGTDAEHTEFQKQGFTVFTWVTVNAGDACPDCRKRQGTTGTMDYFDEIGRPGSGATVCGARCFCILVPKETVYHAPGLARGIDVPGQPSPDPVITTPEEAKKIEAQKITPPPVAATPKNPVDTLRDQMAHDETSRDIVGKIAKSHADRDRKETAILDRQSELTAAARDAIDKKLSAKLKGDNAALEAATRAQRDAMDEFRKLEAKRNGLVEAGKSAAHKRIAVDKAEQFSAIIGIPVQGGAPTTFTVAGMAGEARAAETFVQSVVKRPPEYASSLPNLVVQYKELAPGGRAYHSSQNFAASPNQNTIAVAPTSGLQTIVHEFGHELEARLPGAQKAAQAFIEMRVARSATKTRKLAEVFPGYGFADWETGNEDDFGKVFGDKSAQSFYAGKRYATGETEIVSMGLEKLFADPVGFAVADAEFMAFIVGLLHGRIQF